MKQAKEILWFIKPLLINTGLWKTDERRSEACGKSPSWPILCTPYQTLSPEAALPSTRPPRQTGPHQGLATSVLSGLRPLTASESARAAAKSNSPRINWLQGRSQQLRPPMCLCQSRGKSGQEGQSNERRQRTRTWLSLTPPQAEADPTWPHRLPPPKALSLSSESQALPWCSCTPFPSCSLCGCPACPALPRGPWLSSS